MAAERVIGRRGAAASVHPLVTQTALDVLKRGGNAVDAAVAAAAVLLLVEPRNGHLGGDAFLLIQQPSGEVIALNGSGAAPLAATRERYAALGGIPERGLLASTVPGAVDCWSHAVQRFGTKPLGELLQTAIGYAEEGVPVTPRMRYFLAQDAPIYRECPAAAAVFLRDGEAPPVGALLRQAGAARTLRAIARDGRDAFYRGPVARAMVTASHALGGLFTEEDFAAHRTQEREPLRIDYRGYTVLEQPPVSQGIIVLLALRILEHVDLASFGAHSAPAIHYVVEAIQLAYEDALRDLGDPAFARVDLARLLSSEHAREQAQRIDPRRATARCAPQVIQPDTTFMAVADGQGTMVSYIHSLYNGSGIVLGETGVLMNSRLRGFTLEPGHPNCLEPGKRPLHTLNQYGVQRDGRPILAGGTPGAQWQVQTNVQMLTNVLDFGMDVEQAIHAPRFVIGSPFSADDLTVRIEDRVAPGVIEELRAMGHEVETMGPWAQTGGVQLVARDPESGTLTAVAEPRRPGACALAY